MLVWNVCVVHRRSNVLHSCLSIRPGPMTELPFSSVRKQWLIQQTDVAGLAYMTRTPIMEFSIRVRMPKLTFQEPCNYAIYAQRFAVCHCVRYNTRWLMSLTGRINRRFRFAALKLDKLT